MDLIDPHLNRDFHIEDGVLIIRIVIDENRLEPLSSAMGHCSLLSYTEAPIQVPGSCLKLNLTLFRKH